MFQSGYRLLDRQTGGFHKGELVSIIGRPLMGRTIFALNLFRNIVLDGENNAVFLTSECPACKAAEFLDRMNGNEQPGTADRIVDISACKNVDALLELIRHLRAEKKVDVVILDSFHYLTLFDDLSTSFLYERLADTSRRIKQLAKELGITIIMTSRTNYMVDERIGARGKMPQLSDTDKMGDLACFSDVVLGLYRPEVDGMLVDARGYDMRHVLYVLILKSRMAVAEHAIKFSISPGNCRITEQQSLPLNNLA